MKYSAARDRIATGDIFLFRKSETLFGQLIRWWTQSPFSHVGVAVWMQVGDSKRLTILEALEGSGVRIFPMSVYLREKGTTVDWYALTDPTVSREKMTAFLLDQWGKKYATPKQFIGFVHESWSATETMKNWFCSELASAALEAAGFNIPPEFTKPIAPGVLALFPCLQRKGEIDP